MGSPDKPVSLKNEKDDPLKLYGFEAIALHGQPEMEFSDWTWRQAPFIEMIDGICGRWWTELLPEFWELKEPWERCQ